MLIKSLKKYEEFKFKSDVIENIESDTLFIKLNNTQYELEIADTPGKIQEGLSGRDYIPRKTGMIFIMPKEEIQEFWMKDCNTDMDILFLDSQGDIVNMHRMLRERAQSSFESDLDYMSRLTSYSSGTPAKYAIEIPAGDITRLGLYIGQHVDIPK